MKEKRQPLKVASFIFEREIQRWKIVMHMNNRKANVIIAVAIIFVLCLTIAAGFTEILYA